uniref:Putative salivary secreted basic tail protein n=1 Tax=Rhipicephalus microplus TaxID=6941 RepID=A0A6G5A6D8_RHIMP
MGFFYFLFALLPLAVAQAPTNYDACPNKTWEPEKDPYPHRCVHFCPDGRGWLMAYYMNFTKCWYNDDVNGTCYDGLCYNHLPENVTTGAPPATTEVMFTTASTRSNEETMNTWSNEETRDTWSTESSASDGTTTTKKAETTEEKKKEKERKKKKRRKKRQLNL